MVPHVQLLEIVTEHCPELKLRKQDKTCEFYKDFHVITDFAMSLIKEGEYDRLKKLLAILAELYQHTDSVAAIAFENVLVYKLGLQIEVEQNRKELMEILPEVFRAILLKQINASAI